MMKINDVIRVNGLIGEWRVLDKELISDKHGEVKMIYIIQNTRIGEAATVFVDEDKNFLRQFEYYEDFEEIEIYMKESPWQEVDKRGGRMKILKIAVKKEYFQQIKTGLKKEEYRLIKPYWTKRLAKQYDQVWITLGYPKNSEKEKIIKFKYNGFDIKKIKHKEFGICTVQVYVIKLGDVV